MAVSKRVRFEVLRRDDHTCQYCGATAPDVVITVDHVMPTALGGSDFPDNLVAACEDCNAGKTSITPDSPLVEKVRGAAADFAMRGAEAGAKLRALYEESGDYVFEFEEHWNKWTTSSTNKKIPLPADWKDSVRQWWRIGVPEELIFEAIDIAMEKRGLRYSDHPVFRYMAGIVWKKLEQAGINGSANVNDPAVYTSAEVESIASEREEYQFRLGWSKGEQSTTKKALRYMRLTDSVAMHVDGKKPLDWDARVVPSGA